MYIFVTSLRLFIYCVFNILAQVYPTSGPTDMTTFVSIVQIALRTSEFSLLDFSLLEAFSVIFLTFQFKKEKPGPEPGP